MFDLKDNWTNKFVRNSDDLPDPKAVPKGGSTGALAPLDKIQKDVSWDGKVQRVVLANPSSDSEDEENEETSLGATLSVKSKSAKRDRYEYNHWGEYANWRLHSTDKFAHRIPNFMYNAQSDKLVSYGQGLDIYKRLEESVSDGIRLYAEECDFLEGFHMLVDEHCGFTGIAGGLLEHLGDEYDKKACFGLGLNQPLPETTQGTTSLKDYNIRISNTAQLWSAFNRHARVFSSFGVCQDPFSLHPSPKPFPGIVHDLNIPSISSALLAGALDTLSSPYRTFPSTFPLHEMTSLLNAFGHKMTLISCSMPYPSSQHTLHQSLINHGFSSLASLTPGVTLDLNKSIGNVFVMRGFDKNHVSIKNDKQRQPYQGHMTTVSGCTELFCQERYPKSVHVVKEVNVPFKLKHPFPNLYDRKYLDLHGRGKQLYASGSSSLLPVVAGAHNTPAVGPLLEKMVGVVGGGVGGSVMKMKRFYEPASETCNGAVIDFEDFAESINELCMLKDMY